MERNFLDNFNFEITGEMRRFVKEQLREDEYIFMTNEYLTRKNRVQHCYCSYCNTEFISDKYIKHNKYTNCKHCNTKLIVKNSKFKKGSLRNFFSFYWFDKSKINNNVICCRAYHVSKTYDDYKNPNYSYTLHDLYIYDMNNSISTMYTYDFYLKNWKKRASIFETNNPGWLYHDIYYMSEKNYNNAVSNTKLQYMPLLSQECNIPVVKFVERMIKYPWIEQLWKIGFKQIVYSILEEQSLYNCINYRGKDIFKKLRLDRLDVKKIKDLEIDTQTLRLYQIARKNKLAVSIEDIKKISRMFFDWNDKRKLIEYADVKKIVKYIENQYINYNKDYYASERATAHIWNDYMANCKKMNYNIKDKSYLFPKNLYKAHENILKVIKVKENAEIDKKIESRLDELEKYCFKDDRFIIRPARSSQELINEGNMLHHCVATNYTKPYANGNTDILFIRDINKIDEPLVTVEVKDLIVRQAYGDHDIIPKQDVQEFIEKFKIEILDKLKKKVA